MVPYRSAELPSVGTFRLVGIGLARRSLDLCDEVFFLCGWRWYPSRDAWQKPHEVAMALGLKADESIADLGAGTGYFSRRFARNAAKVWAVDIDPKLLEIAAKGKPANLEIVLGKADNPGLPAAAMDTVFICDVWHHIEGRVANLLNL